MIVVGGNTMIYRMGNIYIYQQYAEEKSRVWMYWGIPKTATNRYQWAMSPATLMVSTKNLELASWYQNNSEKT